VEERILEKCDLLAVKSHFSNFVSVFSEVLLKTLLQFTPLSDVFQYFFRKNYLPKISTKNKKGF